jgi:MFS family permease
MSIISMFVAPVAGRYADKVGGKWILFVGVSLFAGGMGILIASSHVGVSRWHLLPGLIVAGFGLGMTFAPLQTIAMRDVQPRLAGAASGLINTTRQLGAVIGSAAVGALLSAQLTNKMPAAATAASQNLPEQFRQQFVNAFKEVAAAGSEVAGTSTIQLPASIPAEFRSQILAAGKAAFDTGYVNAMRPTLALPIAVMGLAAVSVLLVKRRGADAQAGAPAQAAGAPAAAGEASTNDDKDSASASDIARANVTTD